MANCDFDLDTPGSNNLVDNDNKMSWTNDIPPKNNKRESSEIFDDYMTCDDWVDFELDAEPPKENNPAELSLKNDIPPKAGTPCSTFQSPKNKKIKPIQPLCFDELLENLNYDILYTNFTKLLQFLESDNKEMCHPFTFKEYEDFFQIILRDINILKSKSLDTNYRDICDKIMEAASYDKTGYNLTYVYEYRKEFLKTVLVVKKVNMMDEPPENALSLSSSLKSVMLSTDSSSEADTKILRSTSPTTISNGFKIHCLRTTLAFIKNNVTKNIEFPELSTEQAQFMHLLLESITAFTEFDNNIEIKDLYRALWEAVRIYSLKYEFKIKTVDTWGDKKSLVFEKIPKQKLAETVDSNETAVDSNETPADSNEITVDSIQTTVGSNKTPVVSNETPVNSNETPVDSNENAVTSNQIMKPNTKFLNPVEKITKLTKKMLNKRIKLENIALFVNTLPSTFVIYTLNTIIDFLTDDQRDNIILVPNNIKEQRFYRKSIDWGRTSLTEPMFDGEYKRLYNQIGEMLKHVKCKVSKPRLNKINQYTGLREVAYKKTFVIPAQSSCKRSINKRKISINSDTSADRSMGVSFNKKKKNKLQNNVNSKGTTDNVTIIPNIYQSLRNKKKNKKLKNKNLVKIKDKYTIVGLSNRDASEDSESDTCGGHRGASLDRTKTQSCTKKKSFRYQDNPGWRDIDKLGKEQLIEGLSMPVQSDKAMKMMRGMGWSGGALGARGDGITEPLKPVLDLPRKAGFGHGKSPSHQETFKKPSVPKTGVNWHSENSNVQIETDIIVEKTKQLLLNAPSFDTLINTDLSKLSSNVPIPSNSNSELLNPIDSNAELPKRSDSNSELGNQIDLNAELPNPIDSNAELPKPTTSNVKLPKPTSNVQLPTQTRWNALVTSGKSKVVHPIPFNFRLDMLKSVLQLLTTDETSTTLHYCIPICKKDRNYMRTAMESLKGGRGKKSVPKDHHAIMDQISEAYKELPGFVIKAFLSESNLQVDFKKLPIGIKKESQEYNPISAPLNEDSITSYIESLAPTCQSEKVFNAVKFRLLILLKILEFAKSNTEELEVIFNKVTSVKQRKYIESTIEGVNMRIKFGSTPGELSLSMDIKNHIKDAFLSHMFDHTYTILTINKFFRFKRLNRPDTALKRKAQINVDLDNLTSDNFIDTTTYTNKNNNTDNKATDNEIDNNNGDTSDDEGNNIITDELPCLPPGKGGVSLSPFLCLYDKAHKTGGKTHNEPGNANETDINNKINVGNGNILIDNNDNQVIDMKRVIDMEKDAEYMLCVDYVEDVVTSRVMLIDNEDVDNTNFCNDKIDIVEYDQVIKNDVETVNQSEETDEKIDIDSMDTIIDKDITNTGKPVDQGVILNGDAGCNNISTQNMDKNPCNVFDIKKESADDLIKEIGLDEPMIEIKVKEELMKEPEDVNSIITNEDIVMKAEDETDCDIFLKENIVLSEENCDNQLGVCHFEMVGTKSEIANPLNKIINSEIKHVYIVHIHYPKTIITKERAKKIQKIISYNIRKTKQLPLLMCHGIQHGALIYTCHNKNTFNWLQNTIGGVRYLKVLDTKDVKTIAITFYCYFDFDNDYLFEMIELYNQGISTKEWVVQKTEVHDNYTIFFVTMDKSSINFILASDLALFAGVDKVEFSLIWE